MHSMAFVQIKCEKRHLDMCRCMCRCMCVSELGIFLSAQLYECQTSSTGQVKGYYSVSDNGFACDRCLIIHMKFKQISATSYTALPTI